MRYTSTNADSIASEEFFDWMIGQGVLFAWIFTYMPVGVDAPVELMVQADQRERLYRFVREMRSKKPLFTLDFQNDGEFVGGCIAGGRRYLHINAAGDVEPCVFAHYANANIRETTLLDALKSPIFMQYYERQPFNDNLLRPAHLGEPGRAGGHGGNRRRHSTDLQAKEARDLCAKCAFHRGMGTCGRAHLDRPPIRCSINVTIPAKAWPKPIRTSSIA
ncbi:MAG: SPASM domain-containing protein [Eggerthellaceae bacterium]